MHRRIRQARLDAGLSVQQLADKMHVDSSTIVNWESGRRQPAVDKLIGLSKTLSVSSGFLLGMESQQHSWVKPIAKNALAIMHRCPVWTAGYGWAIINAANSTMIFADKSEISFEVLQEPIYCIPPAFAVALSGVGYPLVLNEIHEKKRVWVEPITSDSQLGVALRGWYHLFDSRLVRNEYGHSFYLDTYGVTWLAFDDPLSIKN